MTATSTLEWKDIAKTYHVLALVGRPVRLIESAPHPENKELYTMTKMTTTTTVLFQSLHASNVVQDMADRCCGPSRAVELSSHEKTGQPRQLSRWRRIQTTLTNKRKRQNLFKKKRETIGSDWTFPRIDFRPWQEHQNFKEQPKVVRKIKRSRRKC